MHFKYNDEMMGMLIPFVGDRVKPATSDRVAASLTPAWYATLIVKLSRQSAAVRSTPARTDIFGDFLLDAAGLYTAALTAPTMRRVLSR
jgi:hypothetical protein